MKGDAAWLRGEEVEVNQLDNAANERTYMAWQRTGLAIMIIGVTLHVLAIAIGGSWTEGVPVFSPIMIATGLLTILYGSYRFKRREKQMKHGVYGADRFGPCVICLISIGVASVGLFILLT